MEVLPLLYPRSPVYAVTEVAEEEYVMAIEIAALRGIPEFGALADTELTYVQQVTRQRRIQRGELLFLEGEPGEQLYYLQSGRVKVFKTSSDGKEQVLRLFHAGETLMRCRSLMVARIPPARWCLKRGWSISFAEMIFAACFPNTRPLLSQ
jgi:signal-transduction protein with cAMP-binding, CBS, and nucleotidyltransferase domain